MTEINGLADEIQHYLERYGSLVSDQVDLAAKETSNNMKKNLTKSDDVPKDTGDYKKGWRVKKKTKRGKPVYVVHNKTDYQLTHLLEKGHALRNGDRYDGKQHIRPATDKAIDEFLEKLKGIMEQ